MRSDARLTERDILANFFKHRPEQRRGFRVKHDQLPLPLKLRSERPSCADQDGFECCFGPVGNIGRFGSRAASSYEIGPSRDAPQAQSMEDENTKLKRLLAEAMLDNAALKDLLGKNV
jgi:hypothetical protein